MRSHGHNSTHFATCIVFCCLSFHFAQFRVLSDKTVANAMQVMGLLDSDIGSIIDQDPKDPVNLPSD